MCVLNFGNSKSCGKSPEIYKFLLKPIWIYFYCNWHKRHCHKRHYLFFYTRVSPTGVESMGRGGGALQNLMVGGGGLSQYMWQAWRGGCLRMLLKNTSEGVHLIVKLPAISLQTCKFTKNELHTYFSRILARF